MQDYQWRHDNKVDGYLTVEQEADILELRDAPNGQILDIPFDYPIHERRSFEERLAPNKNNRIENSVMVSLTPALIIAMHVQAKAYPSLSTAMIEIFFSTLMAASLGHSQNRSKNWKIKDARKTYEARMFSYEGNIQRAAYNAVRSNLVKDADEVVRSGGAIPMATLAKLVNVDNRYFHDACDKLAVTVLQAKALILMNKELVKEFGIATYNSLPFAEIISKTTRAERGDERILRLALEDQFEKMESVQVQEVPEESAQDNTPSKKVTKKSWGIKPVFDWFAKGLKGNLDVFRGVSAGDHLPEIPKVLSVEEIPAEEGLDAMINGYNAKKRAESSAFHLDYLDLPALNARIPKVA